MFIIKIIPRTIEYQNGMVHILSQGNLILLHSVRGRFNGWRIEDTERCSQHSRRVERQPRYIHCEERFCASCQRRRLCNAADAQGDDKRAKAVGGRGHIPRQGYAPGDVIPLDMKARSNAIMQSVWKPGYKECGMSRAAQWKRGIFFVFGKNHVARGHQGL